MMNLLIGRIQTFLKMIEFFYHDASDTIPSNTPKPHGMPAQINDFVDVNHAHNHVTHCSHTGILIYLN